LIFFKNIIGWIYRLVIKGMDFHSSTTKIQLLNELQVQKSINMVDIFPKYGQNEQEKREFPYLFSNIETHVQV